jgi:hypothetical protein
LHCCPLLHLHIGLDSTLGLDCLKNGHDVAGGRPNGVQSINQFLNIGSRIEAHGLRRLIGHSESRLGNKSSLLPGIDGGSAAGTTLTGTALAGLALCWLTLSGLTLTWLTLTWLGLSWLAVLGLLLSLAAGAVLAWGCGTHSAWPTRKSGSGNRGDGIGG